MAKKKWTAQMRKAFARKMKAARAAVARGGKKAGKAALRHTGRAMVHVGKKLAKNTRKHRARRIRHHASNKVVIIATIQGRRFYYAKNNILTTNETAARRYPTVSRARPIASHLARVIPKGSQVALHRA